ncbi:MAG: glycosyltransferase family 39 protein [Promethearchaeota archaeon]
MLTRTSLKRNLLAPHTLNLFLLVLFTVIGTILRFYRLGYQSFWYDEAASILDANNSLYNISHPPLSYVILRVFLEVFGTNEFTARLPACLFGIITIPLVYLFGKQLFGEKEGLVASFIISVFPWYVRWSQEVRMYTELTVFTILALYFFHHAVHKKTITFYVLSAIFVILAFYTHYSGALILGIIIFWLTSKRFLENRNSSTNYKHLVIFFGLCVILALPLVFITIPQTLTFKLGSSAYRWGSPIHKYFLMLFKDAFGPTLSLFSIVGAIYLISQRNSVGYLLTAYAAIPVFTFAALTFITNVAIRYVLFTLPAFALLTARLIIEIYEIIMKGESAKEFRIIMLNNLDLNRFLALGFLFTVVISVANLPGLYNYYSEETHSDWKSACAYVESMRNPEDLVAATDDKVVYYYLGKIDFKLSVELFKPSVFEEIKNSHERVWLLIGRGIRNIDPDYEFRNWLESDCELMNKVDDITIYLFTP